MGTYHTTEYSELRIGSIQLNSYGGLYGISHHGYRNRGINKGKIACYNEQRASLTPKNYIFQRCASLGVQPGMKLYISKHCKISRDLYRKSGYKIVLDPDKADRIVVPDFCNDHPYFYYDLLAYDSNDKTLYMLTIHKNGYTGIDYKDITEKDISAVEDYFKRNGLKVLSDGIQMNSKLDIMTNCEEYIDILYDKYPQREYIQERDVTLSLPVDINIETLSIWMHSKDYGLIAKSICNSNWREYPFTLCVFMNCFCLFIPYYGNSMFKCILDQIGYEKGSSLREMFAHRSIDAKDWNMSQDLILHILGLGEKGGYVDETKIPTEAYSLIRHKTAVIPLRLDSAMSIENIASLLD